MSSPGTWTGHGWMGSRSSSESACVESDTTRSDSKQVRQSEEKGAPPLATRSASLLQWCRAGTLCRVPAVRNSPLTTKTMPAATFERSWSTRPPGTPLPVSTGPHCTCTHLLRQRPRMDTLGQNSRTKLYPGAIACGPTASILVPTPPKHISSFRPQHARRPDLTRGLQPAATLCATPRAPSHWAVLRPASPAAAWRAAAAPRHCSDRG